MNTEIFYHYYTGVKPVIKPVRGSMIVRLREDCLQRAAHEARAYEDVGRKMLVPKDLNRIVIDYLCDLWFFEADCLTVQVLWKNTVQDEILWNAWITQRERTPELPPWESQYHHDGINATNDFEFDTEDLENRF